MKIAHAKVTGVFDPSVLCQMPHDFSEQSSGNDSNQVFGTALIKKVDFQTRIFYFYNSIGQNENGYGYIKPAVHPVSAAADSRYPKNQFGATAGVARVEVRYGK
jgi:hypothetical protein